MKKSKRARRKRGGTGTAKRRSSPFPSGNVTITLAGSMLPPAGLEPATKFLGGKSLSAGQRAQNVPGGEFRTRTGTHKGPILVRLPILSAGGRLWSTSGYQVARCPDVHATSLSVVCHKLRELLCCEDNQAALDARQLVNKDGDLPIAVKVRARDLPALEPTKSAVLNEPDLKEGPANVRSYFDVQLAA